MAWPTDLGVTSRYALFLAAGVAPMGAELLWMRGLAQSLGHDAPAVLGVMAAMFAGAAVGAWGLERIVRRARGPGRAYAVLSWVVASGVLLSAVLVPWCGAMGRMILGVDSGTVTQGLVAFVLPWIVLLPATAAWGGSWVAMDRWLAPAVRDGRCLGGLAAGHALGSVLGVLLAVLWLVPVVGMANALALFALWHAAIGFVAWRSDARAPESIALPPRPDGAGRRLGSLFLLGWIGLGLQAWVVRVLAPVFAGTVYSFACVLIAYLVATTIGAALFHRGPRGVLAGLLAGETGASLGRQFSVLALILAGVGWLGWWVSSWRVGDAGVGALLVELGVAMTVVTIPGIVLGLLLASLLQSSRDRHGGLGVAFACNSFGAACGAIVIGALIWPAFDSGVALAVLIVACALAIPAWNGRRGLLVVGALLLVTPLLAIAWDAPRDHDGVQIASRRDGLARASVIEWEDGARELRVNRRFTMGGTAAANAERRQAHLPLLLHEDPRSALFLGVGTGITVGAAAVHEQTRVEAVELLPGVVDLLPYFAEASGGIAAAPTGPVQVADARRFVASTDSRYDVIVGDVFHPGRDGAGSLFSLEHFRAIRSRLNRGGLFCQWLPLHQWGERPLRGVVATFLEVFPLAEVYLLRFNLDLPVIGLVGHEREVRHATGWFERRVRSAALQEALKRIPWQDDVRVLGTYLGGASGLREFARGARWNTDDRPWITFAVPLQDPVNPIQTLDALLSCLKPEVTDLLFDGHHENARRLQAYWQARDEFLAGLRLERQGRRDAAIDRFRTSLETSPDFSVAYAHCLRLVVLLHREDEEASRRLLDHLITVHPDRGAAAALRARLFEGG